MGLSRKPKWLRVEAERGGARISSLLCLHLPIITPQGASGGSKGHQPSYYLMSWPWRGIDVLPCLTCPIHVLSVICHSFSTSFLPFLGCVVIVLASLRLICNANTFFLIHVWMSVHVLSLISGLTCLWPYLLPFATLWSVLILSACG